MSLENSGEILARSYKGGCGWLLDGSYKHGVAVSTPEDYGEEVKGKTTVWKIIIYRVEEGLGAKEKGKRSMMPWNLQEGNVDQLLLGRSQPWVYTGITWGLVKA